MIRRLFSILFGIHGWRPIGVERPIHNQIARTQMACIYCSASRWFFGEHQVGDGCRWHI